MLTSQPRGLLTYGKCLVNLTVKSETEADTPCACMGVTLYTPEALLASAS